MKVESTEVVSVFSASYSLCDRGPVPYLSKRTDVTEECSFPRSDVSSYVAGAPLALGPWPLSCRSLPPPQGGGGESCLECC